MRFFTRHPSHSEEYSISKKRYYSLSTKVRVFFKPQSLELRKNFISAVF